MTLERIDQLVFGYEEGHRLLGGSTRIPGTALAVLLGATDAPIESSGDRLVTGLPLDEIARYALCFTWNAPELPRPGAVWSHVLLLEFRHLELLGIVGLLRRLARRPEPLAVGQYQTQLSLVPDRAPSQAPALAVSHALIGAIAESVYGDGDPVVVHKDLAESEEALFAVWEAQWPKLRSRFEFRTRESARISSSSGVVVARRVRGLMRHGNVPQRTAWITMLTDSIARRRGDPLRGFLGMFGPTDLPEAGTVGWLSDLYCCVVREDCSAVREALESRYHGQRSGSELKEQLFGPAAGSWWSVSEASRLSTILGAGSDAWDLQALALERRLRDWIQGDGVRALLQDWSKGGPESVRDALLNAVVHTGRASDLVPMVRSDPELAARWLVETPEVGWDPDAWRGLEHGEVSAVWDAVGSPDASSVLAATVAGHGQAAIEVLGLGSALCIAARAGDFAAATALVEASSWIDATKAAKEESELALLLGAIAGGRDVPGLIVALEARRDEVNETWLRAAVGAMSRPSLAAGRVLEVVFGPLHHGITDDRLPSECWELLNRVLPEAPDPALRLRRFLIRTAKEEGWRQKTYRRALRGAGPYAAELYREVKNDELLLGGIRSFIERL